MPYISLSLCRLHSLLEAPDHSFLSRLLIAMQISTHFSRRVSRGFLAKQSRPFFFFLSFFFLEKCRFHRNIFQLTKQAHEKKRNKRERNGIWAQKSFRYSDGLICIRFVTASGFIHGVRLLLSIYARLWVCLRKLFLLNQRQS